ncbi:MAG: PBP1A family penicillin-binding protein [Candidatus Melainabacteria bacterium]|nr:PBP1A family penicillin-binding protein [Candidatus Melainabacteria bacterium]
MFPPIVYKIGNVIKYTALVVFTAFILAMTIFGALVYWDLRDIPDLAYLEHYHHGSPIEIYDRNDKLVLTVNPGVKHRIVPLSQVSSQMTQAVVAVEDRQFFEHAGVSFIGVTRAMLANIKAGRMVEGGSTITQQLVKNLFHEGEKRTLIRKLSETALAFMIECRYSKWQILQAYLNEIYFGNGAWGVEQAAMTYFGKHANALTLPEAAFIAGLIKSPSILGDQKNRIDALKRQKQVLGMMADNGYISPAQYETAMMTPLMFGGRRTTIDTTPFDKFPYYISYVLEMVKVLLPDEGDTTRIGRGVRVYTTLDQDAQRLAEATIKKGIDHAPRGIDEGAIVACAVSNGAVRALVGGAGDFWKNQWNCATNPHTAGSSFKPFVYLAAFVNGALDSESFLDDSKLEVPQIGGVTYTPKNYDGKFLGKITVRQALYQSRNVCAVKVARQIGMQPIIMAAQDAGIKSPLQANLSLALGSAAVSPIEMAGAYGTFARAGVAVEPWTVRMITSLDGRNVLHKYDPYLHRVFDPHCVLELNSILEDVVTKGTGVAAKLKDRAVAGKTGTSDNSTDLWFVGFTPDMVTAVWAGNKDHSASIGKKVTGGTVAAAIFRDFNSSYYKVHKLPAGEMVAKSSSTKQKADEDLKAQQNLERKLTPKYAPRAPRPIPEPVKQQPYALQPLKPLKPKEDTSVWQAKPESAPIAKPVPQPQLQPLAQPAPSAAAQPVLTDGNGGLRATAKALVLPAVAKPKSAASRRSRPDRRRAYQSGYPGSRKAYQPTYHPAGGVVVRSERNVREFHWR